jgi:hypothetical protein
MESGVAWQRSGSAEKWAVMMKAVAALLKEFVWRLRVQCRASDKGTGADRRPTCASASADVCG